MSSVEALAEALQRLRERRKRSYTALEHATGISRSALQRYCTGVQVPTTFATVERIGRACGAQRQELDKLYFLWKRADAERDAPVPVSTPAGAPATADDQPPAVEAPPTQLHQPAAPSPPDAPEPPVMSPPARAWAVRRRFLVALLGFLIVGVAWAAVWLVRDNPMSPSAPSPIPEDPLAESLSPASCFIDGRTIVLYSVGMERFVSAEIGYPASSTGMLRARATAIGPWEKYTVILNNDGSISLRAQANGALVSAELGFSEPWHALLRARATEVGPWERFAVAPLANGVTFGLRSTANELYVSAENYAAEGNGALRARASNLASSGSAQDREHYECYAADRVGVAGALGRTDFTRAPLR